jgi:hypothetical protein
MTNKTIIIALVTCLGLGYAGGRYSKSDEVIETTKIVNQDDKKNDINKDTTRNTDKVIVIVHKPDGTTMTTITDKTRTDTHLADKSTDDSKTQTDTFKEVLNNTNKVNVSLLVGTGLSLSSGLTPIYGISLNKNFIGPITIGVWGMSNKTGGFSLGVNL